jgi:cation transport ATPase
MLEQTTPLAVFAVADAVRDESREAVRRLHEQGIEVIMMTGDARAVADAVAAELGIDTVFAEVLPEDKAAQVKTVQARGKRVAMVGDGVNDAPALLTADVGIAIGAGTDVAVEAGDVVLVRSDPRDVPRIIALSRATYRKMIQNLWWAAGYNVVAIPLAAGVLTPWGHRAAAGHRRGAYVAEHHHRGDQRPAPPPHGAVTVGPALRGTQGDRRSQSGGGIDARRHAARPFAVDFLARRALATGRCP